MSGKGARVVDGHPVVVPNVRVDVGRHERRNGRVMRREAKAQGPHVGRTVRRVGLDRHVQSGSALGPVDRGVEDRDERRGQRRLPQPRGRVAHLLNENGYSPAVGRALRKDQATAADP